MPDTPPTPRSVAEAHFKEASAEAALFELWLRMLAGIQPEICDKRIDVELSKVKDAILGRFQARLTTDEKKLLTKACYLRNKLLHCELSAVRENLNYLDPKQRGGEVTKVVFPSGMSLPELEEIIRRWKAGEDVGQTLVTDADTKRLKDIFGWLLECQSANEFEEAKTTFRQAMTILERLARPE